MTGAFHPPLRTLMGPGPSDVPPQVLEALGRPTIGHLDPQFVTLMDDIKRLLQYVFQTDNALTLPISAPGSAGMEAAFVNLIEPGDKVIVCQNGVFGGRMKENVERCGASAIMVEDTWGTEVSLDKVEQAFFENNNIKALAFVHAETSTGVRSDAKALAAIAHKHDALVIMDTVTGLAGIPVEVDTWGIDCAYSGTQKCLSCTPGIAPITFSQRAQDVIANRSTKVQSWFLDMQLIMGYWGANTKRAYHHTAPVNAMYALHESLRLVEAEGLAAAHARHALHHKALVAGLEAMGLSMAVAADVRLPQLNAVNIPEGVDDGGVRAALLEQFDLEIGAGLGALAGKTWRIGLMGFSAKAVNVRKCLLALETVLSAQGANIAAGQALAAAEAVYQA
ncbi:Serine--pyruvate aminotransferase / L-alanine:glyoxylate aminotransferase [Aequoribacter fuscus]|uniref:Serine--pyruvate aminotransferase / L-alanine:glyoxylate aminotransferase n=1 Tax=Aequoribacter fuscus TaxID=2518989 RepID=F3L181_9GAMM|nr:alanine--glyoxylate aminotransferase family protein [Aequoribacter fuscus]EGG29907.1 Serine--pyruvate aminotransferase / L-alanine:glyoxylate aminotransferase [Aequoribacter fuscus]QHJ87812.1 alanine--glyoxylate aminotransferase family protein [Aequoribacter fuscus]